MDTRQFIDLLGAGQSSEAKSALEDLISAKAFEALEAKKQEIGSTLFNGKEPEVAVEVETQEEQ